MFRLLKNNENRFVALQINRQQSDATYVSLSNRTRSDELFDVINLIAFKHMLVRPRDIGYYRKKGDRSSLHSLLDKFNCPSTSKPPLRQRDAFLHDSNCQSITVYLPKIIQRHRDAQKYMLRLVTKRLYQSFSATVVYIALHNFERLYSV